MLEDRLWRHGVGDQ